jgi:two-component system aerobic respiration control sensor histidine kinase ArcB
MFTPTVKEIAGWNRSELELAFRESQKRLTEMVENAPIPIVLQDRAFRYVLANQYVRTLFWHGRDLVGKTPFEVWPPETAARLVERLRDVMECQSPRVSEDVLPQPDGERTMLVHRFPLRDINGDTGLIAVLGVDITEQKRTETQARQGVADAERAKRGLLDQMSQRLRTPINDLVGYAEMLQTERLSPSAANNVDGIVTAAGRLLALIDQMPEMTQIETTGGPQTGVTPVHPASLPR